MIDGKDVEKVKNNPSYVFYNKNSIQIKKNVVWVLRIKRYLIYG
jgi:hypothetical protein